MRLNKLTLITFMVSALVLTMAAFGQDKVKDGPKLVVDNTKFEFGKVKEGEEISHVFKIKNEGTSELVIANVSPACGCTASDFTKSLAPGQEGVIKLSVKTAGMNGWTERYADVISNDTAQPNLKLWVKMDVEKKP